VKWQAGSGMIKPYRILIIEDDPNDVELMRRGFEMHDEFFIDVSTTGEDAQEKMAECSYDLISIDFALPGISGLDVLENLREFDQDIPVVMVTGRDTEELQVVAFQKHATSYVAKSVESFRSLPYIFEALIKEAQFRSAETKIRYEMKRSEIMSQHILDNSPVGIYVLQNGCFKLVNTKFGEIFGCQPGDLIGKPFCDVVDPETFECVDALDQHKTAKDEGHSSTTVHEFKVSRKDGSKHWVEAQLVQVNSQDERWVLGNLVDITKRRNEQDALLRRNRDLSVLHDISLKATDFCGDLDDLLDGILSDVMIGLSDAELRGIFLLESGRLVLRSLEGPLETLMIFLDGMSEDVLLERPRLGTFPNSECVRFWASAPLIFGGRPFGLMVIGCKDRIDVDLVEFLKMLAQHVGRMTEIFQLRRSALEEDALKEDLEFQIFRQSELLPDVTDSLERGDVTGNGNQDHSPSKNFKASDLF